MMKDILRGIGIGCLLAGGILYFTNLEQDSTDEIQYKAQVDELQTELDKVKKELAVAQTLSSPKVDTAGSQETNANEGETDSESSGTTSTPITKIILTIEPGSTSKTVANRLERAGIIGSARELEQYLLDNNLSGRIQIGEHEVDTSMDLDTIARIITNTTNR
jgi:hypothetical protein